MAPPEKNEQQAAGRNLFHSPADTEALFAFVTLRLRAEEVDGNAQHILDAIGAVLKAGLQPGGDLCARLAQVLPRLRVRYGRGRGKPQWTFRLLALIDAVRELTGAPDVPAMLPSDLLTKLCQRFNMTKPAVVKVFRRIRKLPGVTVKSSAHPRSAARLAREARVRDTLTEVLGSADIPRVLPDGTARRVAGLLGLRREVVTATISAMRMRSRRAAAANR